MSLEFSTPPENPSGRKVSYTKEAAALKARPGEWAKIDVSHMSKATRASFPARINAGTYKALTPGFEAVGRRGETWLRYIGPNE